MAVRLLLSRTTSLLKVTECCDVKACRAFSKYSKAQGKKAKLKKKLDPRDYKLPAGRGLIEYVPKKMLKNPSPEILELPEHEEKAAKFKTPWNLISSVITCSSLSFWFFCLFNFV